MRAALASLLFVHALATLSAAEDSAIDKVLDTCAEVPWVQGAWVSAPGSVGLVDDAPSAQSDKDKKSLQVEARFPGTGFMFYNAEPPQPLLIPGRTKSLSVWYKGDGPDLPVAIGLVDGWGRTEANGRKFEWSLGSAKQTEWTRATFTVPADWVQPIRIASVMTHNWSSQQTAVTVHIRLSNLAATYDLGDTDPATGALRSWKPDPQGASRKDAPKECPRAPLLDCAVVTGREGNVFAGETPSVTIAARSWKGGTLDGALSWTITDLSGGEPAKAPLASGNATVTVADRPVSQRLPLEVPRLGLYRFDAEIAWKSGERTKQQLVLAAIAAVPNDDDASRDASPYGLNTHGGGRSTVDAWNKAGLRWIRDYAWGFGVMKNARDASGAFTGWPWYPKILARYQQAHLRLLACMMDGIPDAVGDPKVPQPWKRDLGAILAAFPAVTHWELANEWDLDWKNEHHAKDDKAHDWPFYRAYHKAFGQVVSAVDGIAVENGRAGIFPDELRSFVTKGDFADIAIANGHYYTGVSAPETCVTNANTGGGGASTSLCYPDLLREASRAAVADGKPRKFWVTEFGWDTKAGPIVSRMQQAVYLQRGYLIAAANGVERSFWFFDFDAPKATAFFDGCGIMDENAQPKLSYCSLSALTRVLPNPKYLGPLDAGPGTWGYLFEDHGKLVAALWTVDNQDGPEVAFAGGKLSDFLGNPIKGKSAKLGIAPIYCADVPRSDRWLKQACYEVDGLRLVALAAGDHLTIPVAVTNHRAEALKGKLKLRLPADWTAATGEQSVELAPGKSTKIELAAVVSSKAEPREYEAVVEVDEGSRICELRVRVLVGSALQISAPALGNAPGTSPIEVTIANRSQRALTGTVTLKLPAGWSSDPASAPFSGIAAGATQRLPFKVTWNDSWKAGEEAWAVAATDDGVSVRTALQPGVMTIPHLAKLTPDGDTAEWPATSLLPAWMVGSTEGAANAEVRLAWTDGGLALAVTAHDSIAQSTDPRAFWDMDATELFIDTTGTPAARAFAASDHQLWLVPLPAEKRVYLGRWKRASEIPETRYDVPGVVSAAKKTADGYAYEALIPAAALTGFKPQAGSVIGLDLVLTVNGRTGRREVYWPWGKRGDAAGKPELWGRVKLGE